MNQQDGWVALAEVIKASFPFAAGIIAAVTTLYLGRLTQKHKLEDRQASLTFRQQEWVNQQAARITEDLRLENQRLQAKLDQERAVAETKAAQAAALDANADEVVAKLLEQCDRLREDNNLLNQIVRQQEEELLKLQRIIPSGALTDFPFPTDNLPGNTR